MTCLFSGESADTDEHVIPMWLQRRLKLTNQTLYLPNGTKLPYKYAKVPAKLEHNARFAKIEERISKGIFDPLEIYLWAFKIHLGLIYRDSTLNWDIRDPSSQKIFERGNFESDILLFQSLYKVWASGGSIDPAPFGSVFVIESPTPHDSFDLIHCLPTGTVAIDIGTNFILVLLWDQNFASSSNALSMWNDFHLKAILAAPEEDERHAVAYLSTHAWTAEVSYYAHRHSRSFSFLTTENSATGIATGRSRPLDFSEDEFEFVALNCGLERALDPRTNEYAFRKRSPPPKRI